MLDPGSLLILFALALMLVSPIHVTITRPRLEIAAVVPALLEAFPAPVPTPDLAELVRMADEALAADPMISATARLRDIYDQA